MDHSDKFKLYNYYKSTASWRVRIALNLKKIQFQYIPINLAKGQQKTEEYRKINPNQVYRVIKLQGVPTLDDGGVLIVESMAICEYLEQVYPGIKLLPLDTIQKAQVRGFCEIINSAMHPYQSSRMNGWVETLVQGFDRVAFMQPILHKGFTALDKLLQQSHGLYSFGDTLSLADVFLVPQVSSALARFQVDMNKYPTLNQVYQNLINIPEFVAAQPDQQQDFVTE